MLLRNDQLTRKSTKKANRKNKQKKNKKGEKSKQSKSKKSKSKKSNAKSAKALSPKTKRRKILQATSDSPAKTKTKQAQKSTSSKQPSKPSKAKRKAGKADQAIKTNQPSKKANKSASSQPSKGIPRGKAKQYAGTPADPAWVEELRAFGHQSGQDTPAVTSPEFKERLRGLLAQNLTWTALNLYWTRCGCGVTVWNDEGGSYDIHSFSFGSSTAAPHHKLSVAAKCAEITAARSGVKI